MMLVFGDKLITASRTDHVLHVWNYHSGELYAAIELDDYLTVSSIMHPDTYLNKIVIGTNQGELLLWNLKSNKCVYRFKGWNSAVRCVEQSPAVDVVGIGLEDGRIVLHNLKTDKTLLKFTQSEGPVTTLSFRTEPGFEQMVSGSTVGTLAVWDLENKKLITVMRQCHDGPVSRAHFFAGEPILVTSGPDNAINMWIFDQTDGAARLLKCRTGHSRPPTKIRFAASSTSILSGGLDRTLRFFHTIRDQQAHEFSQGSIEARTKALSKTQGHVELRLAPITDFDYNSVKEKQWDSIITSHRGLPAAVTWNYPNQVMGKYRLASTDRTKGQKSPVTAVCISACGNYGIIGSQTGAIDKYNMQSGIHRGSYPDTALLDSSEASEMKHTAEVTGLCVDAVNCYLMSGSIDGTVKFWDFNNGTLHKSVVIGQAVAKLCLARDSSLLAVVTDDFVIHVYDIDTQVCVRRLHGHSAAITDLAFTPDGRWIVAADADSYLRVWDLPTGSCVEWVTMQSPITSLTISPRGDFLATSHIDSRGIFLWANQNHFGNLFLQPVTAPHPVVAPLPLLESNLVDQEDSDSDDEEDTEKTEMEVDETKELQDKMLADDASDDEDDDLGLYRELISLSKAPKSKWRTLINLETMNARNKPEKLPEAPKAAPFFLPNLPDLKGKFIAMPEEEIELPDLKRMSMAGMKPQTPLIAALHQAVLAKAPKGKSLESPSPFLQVAEMLKTMSPSAIDFEMTSLSMDNNFAEFTLVLRFVLDQLQRNVNYEMAQALLNVFLKHQGDVLASALEDDKELETLFSAIQSAQSAGWSRLQTLFHSNLCLVSFFSNLQS